MPRMTKVQLAERMRREAKRVRDRNYRFRQMTKTQQRVAIAKDVLKLLEEERIIAEKSTYMTLDEDIESKYWTDPFDDDFGEGPREEHEDVQLHTVLDQVESCRVCGIGACFVAAVRRADRCTVGDLSRAADDDFMRMYLCQWFPEKQVELIEVAFETDTLFTRIFREDSDAAIAARDFGKRYPRDSERLEAIFQNIIDNEGHFDPTDVRTLGGRRLSPELETAIRLHTLSLMVSGWFPPGSALVQEARRVIGPCDPPKKYNGKRRKG